MVYADSEELYASRRILRAQVYHLEWRLEPVPVVGRVVASLVRDVEGDDLRGNTNADRVSLEAGNDLLICNIVNMKSGETASHYQQRMRAALTVT